MLTQNILSSRGRTIRPKTLNQKRYVDAIDKHTIVFGIGPAGTGKTYLAMAKAVQALQSKQVNRIILTRPAVEAGERLGFLPGTLYEKIDPYLRPPRRHLRLRRRRDHRREPRPRRPGPTGHPRLPPPRPRHRQHRLDDAPEGPGRGRPSPRTARVQVSLRLITRHSRRRRLRPTRALRGPVRR
ncbi:hypothetical protein STENM327S_09450 [Streptomyces tendae]